LYFIQVSWFVNGNWAVDRISRCWIPSRSVEFLTLISGTNLLFSDQHNFYYAYAFAAGVFGFFALFTIFGIREIPQPPPRRSFSFRYLISEFYLDPAMYIVGSFWVVHSDTEIIISYNRYKDFYWVILTRFFWDMAVYSIVPFFFLLYKDILHNNQWFNSYLMKLRSFSSGATR
jgi:hypothetical protein